jgi:maleate isomerase
VQESIVRNYASIGVEISCESHLGLSDNLAIGMIDATTLENSVSTVVNGGVEAVTTFCTNFQAAQRVAQWERKYKVAIFDTVSTVIWDMLQSCGVDTRELASKWGQLFEGTCYQR